MDAPTSDLTAFASPPGTAIRPYAEGDLSAVATLARAEGWTAQDIAPEGYAEAWRNSRPALVCSDAEGAIVGFVRAVTDGRITVYVAELLVAPAWRGRGVASALLDGCHTLVPTARLDLLATADSAPFYERRGYRPFRGYRRSRR